MKGPSFQLLIQLWKRVMALLRMIRTGRQYTDFQCQLLTHGVWVNWDSFSTFSDANLKLKFSGDILFI